MRRIDFHVPIYDWMITIVTIYNQGCKEDVKSLLKEFHLPLQDEVMKNIENEDYNGGKIFTRKSRREAVVIIFPWKSEEAFVRTINHEKRHIVDSIVKWHNIEDAEAAAYPKFNIFC